ncbi:MAG: hypothetical protein WA996_12160, partial [Candidatus Promineifilaceae bacterium]
FELLLLGIAAPVLFFPNRWTPLAFALVFFTWLVRWLAFGRLTHRTPLVVPELGLLIMAVRPHRERYGKRRAPVIHICPVTLQHLKKWVAFKPVRSPSIESLSPTPVSLRIRCPRFRPGSN